MKGKVLNVRNLCKVYPSFQLRDVTFDLEPGAIMGLIGANGAGKSTTIRCITGQTVFEKGDVVLNELNLKKNPKEFKSKIGYVCENIDIYSSVRAKEFYEFVKSFYINWDDIRFKKLIEDFELNLNQRIKTYSKGMRVKLHLAIALSHRAEILIMDEPTSGLDPVIRSQMLQILMEEIKQSQSALLFSTHITEDIQKIATDVCFISDGSIIMNDKVGRIRDQYIEVMEFPQWQFILGDDIIQKIQNRIIVKRNETTVGELSKRGIEYNRVSFDDLLIMLIKTRGHGYV